MMITPDMAHGSVMFTWLPCSVAAAPSLPPTAGAGESPDIPSSGGPVAKPLGATGSLSSVPVLLRGLPNSLCNSACMEVVLENAGLEGCVVGCDARPGDMYGEAVVRLTTLSWAHYCVKRFEGRVWDALGAPVHAKVLDADWSTPSADVCDVAASPASEPKQELWGTDEPVTEFSKEGAVQRHRPGTLEISPCSTKFSSPSRSRRMVSWADLTSDDEEDSTCSGTNGEETTEEGLDFTESKNDDDSSTTGCSRSDDE